MFEDQNKQNPNPPGNLPTEPVDMFADVEKEEAPAAPAEPVASMPDALSAGLLKKKEIGVPVVAPPPDLANLPSAAPAQGYAIKAPILGKVLLAVGVLALLGGLCFGGWWVYANFMGKKSADVTPLSGGNNLEPPGNIVPTNTPEEEMTGAFGSNGANATSDVSARMNNDEILFGESVDSDKDGLDDIREKEIGTDQLNLDTDGDGLSDGDEVIIWKTNPLNPDTDGDGYSDGVEVRNGYNPLGAGRLFNVPANSTSTTSSVSKSPTTTE